MPAPEPSARAGRVVPRLLWLSLAGAALIGGLVLLGWALDVEWLRQLTPLPDQPRVKANTAACIVATSAAVALLVTQPVSAARRRAAQAAAVLVCLVAGTTIVEHLVGVDPGLDQLLVHERPGAVRTPHLGRMAINTALAFALMGLAVLTFERRWRSVRVVLVLAGCVGGIALLALIGILLNADSVPGVSQYARMAPITAVALLLLVGAVTLARPDSTAFRLLTGPGIASQATRLLAPIVLVVPASLGYLRLQGQYRGLYGLELGTWLLVSSLTVILAGASSALVARLDRAERRSEAAERGYRDAKAAAEAANQAKSAFLSRMSHELRTPLNAVLGFAQLLEMKEAPARDTESAAHILTAGRHLLELIDEVLDISRIEMGSMRLSVESVDVVSALDEAVALMRPVADAQGLELSLDLGDGGSGHALADRQRLRQVVLNLVSNAVKYNRADGTVRVSFTCASNHVQVTVEDTGFGIAADKLDRLFVPFDRLGAEMGPVEGTGLGLALSKSLVEQMGGTLSAASTPGAGSVFTVELRSAPDPDDARRAFGAAAALEPARAGAGTILHIEDNGANARLVEACLAGYPGVELVLAMHGMTGLELARAHRPALILLDLHLPDMEGVAVLERLQADPATASIPVVVLSADATGRQTRTCLDAGARAYLAKPLNVAGFLEVIDEQLAGDSSGDDPLGTHAAPIRVR